MQLALLVGNRGFFPDTVIAQAYEEMRAAFSRAGADCLAIDPALTRFGAVETTEEGLAFARFLAAHRSQYDGLVICMPNFSDENGIKAAIAEVDVPILLQAYPDTPGQMDFDHRRDAFCGKLALTSVLRQMRKPFTVFDPFVVHPASPSFDRQLSDFMAVCRVVRGMRRMRVGAFGARTTAFKSVRYDEMALERHGVDVETIDLSAVLRRVRDLGPQDAAVQGWHARLLGAGDFSAVPEGRDLVMARLAAALDGIIQEMRLDAAAIRCWGELQQELGVTPCAAMGLFNHDGIPFVCETDVTNVLAMSALALASGRSSGCLDLNNNYGDEADKCILFHCGPLPEELMASRGTIEEHKMLSKSYGAGCSWGLNVSRIAPGLATYSGMRTEDGVLSFYLDEGAITDDPVEPAFFGTPGVLETPNLQRKLRTLAQAGYRHHVALTHGHVAVPVAEALVNYLGYARTAL